MQPAGSREHKGTEQGNHTVLWALAESFTEPTSREQYRTTYWPSLQELFAGKSHTTYQKGPQWSGLGLSRILLVAAPAPHIVCEPELIGWGVEGGGCGNFLPQGPEPCPS